jgi:hypothetical protein
MKNYPCDFGTNYIIFIDAEIFTPKKKKPFPKKKEKNCEGN